MLSIQNALPNFLKILVLASAALLSMNAFAENKEASDSTDVEVDQITILHDKPSETEEASDEETKKDEMKQEIEEESEPTPIQ